MNIIAIVVIYLLFFNKKKSKVQVEKLISPNLNEKEIDLLTENVSMILQNRGGNFKHLESLFVHTNEYDFFQVQQKLGFDLWDAIINKFPEASQSNTFINVRK